jgi:uncharacterized protein Yka (UPF0111/DUF47 family)
MQSEIQYNMAQLIKQLSELVNLAEDVQLDMKDYESDADEVSRELDEALKRIVVLEQERDAAIEALDWAEYELENACS